MNKVEFKYRRNCGLTAIFFGLVAILMIAASLTTGGDLIGNLLCAGYGLCMGGFAALQAKDAMRPWNLD